MTTLREFIEDRMATDKDKSDIDVDLTGADTVEAVSERIRAELMARGIDPDTVYPVGVSDIGPSTLNPETHEFTATFQYKPH
jgi:hypothetical protein